MTANPNTTSPPMEDPTDGEEAARTRKPKETGEAGTRSSSKSGNNPALTPIKSDGNTLPQLGDGSALGTAIELTKLGLYVGITYGVRDGVCTCKDGAACGSPGKHSIGGPEQAEDDPGRFSKLKIYEALNQPETGLFVNLHRSGLIDIAPDSEEWLAEFQQRGLPETLTYESGSGAGHVHHLYRAPEGTAVARKCISGEFDLMSGGIAIVPPTVSGKGPYRWLNLAEIADAPQWAVDEINKYAAEKDARKAAEALSKSRRVSGPPVRLSDLGERLWSGEEIHLREDGKPDRSTTLTHLAHELALAGATESAIYDAIAERDVALGFEKYTNRTDADTRYWEIAVGAVEGAERHEGDRQIAESFFQRSSGSRRTMRVSELMSLPKPKFRIREALQEDSLAAIYGAPGTYKSFAALHMAMSIALGHPWFGHQISATGPVVYIVAEGLRYWQNRVNAQCRELGISPDVLEDKLIIIREPITVSDHLDVMRLVEEINGELAELNNPQPPALIVVDTLAQNYGRGSENQQDDMQLFVSGLDLLRRTYTDSVVLAVHHTNGLGGLRGSTVLPAALTTIIRAEVKDGVLTLHVEKQKDGMPNRRITLKPHIIRVGEPQPLGATMLDEDTSVVLRPHYERGDGLTDNQRKLLQALGEAPGQELKYSDLVEKSGVAVSSAKEAIAKLIEANKVTKEPKGRNTLYRLVVTP